MAEEEKEEEAETSERNRDNKGVLREEAEV